MDDDKYTEVILPTNNKSVKEFLLFPQEKQLQILKLGLSTYTYSSQKFRSTIDGEKEDIVEKLTTQYTKELQDIRSTNCTLHNTITDLKKTNQQQKVNFHREKETEINEQKYIIQNNLERLYGEKIKQMTDKIEFLENNNYIKEL